MESPTTHPAAHPIRCWYGSVVIQRRVDSFVSAIKVCTWCGSSFVSSSWFTYMLCLTPFMSLMHSQLTDYSTASLPPSFLMLRFWWQARNLKLVGGNAVTIRPMHWHFCLFVCNVVPMQTCRTVAFWSIHEASNFGCFYCLGSLNTQSIQTHLKCIT